MTSHEEWRLNTGYVGKRVLVFDQLDSTNNFLLARADDPTQDGLVVLADAQTAGRGQHGRTWSCPKGAGVLMSVLVFPAPALRRPSVMTAWAAVSVCQVIQNVSGIQAALKWPNDVLISGRKVAGILIEQKQGIVVGIGVNLNQPADYFAAAGLEQAASLSMFVNRTWDSREFARQLILELDDQYTRMLEGDLTRLEADWRRGLGLVGKDVMMETLRVSHRGRLVALGFDQLQVHHADGKAIMLAPEQILHMTVQPEPGARCERDFQD